jgi:hypothetical protein
VRALFDNWLQWLQDASSPGGCLFLAASTELDDKEGRPRDFLVGMQRQLLLSLAKTARLAIEAGPLPGDLDCDQFAFELYGLLLGHSHFRRLLRDPRAESRTRGAFDRLVRSAAWRTEPNHEVLVMRKNSTNVRSLKTALARLGLRAGLQ